MTVHLAATLTQRVPFSPGGPVRAVLRGDRVTLVGLGPENVDTQWVDVAADGSVHGPLALSFAVESAIAAGEELVLSGNEPGSDAPVVITVDIDGAVSGRHVVDADALTRWPVPVPTVFGLALLWETADGLYWSAPHEPPQRIGGPGETNALVVVADGSTRGAVVVRSTSAGAVEVSAPPDRAWQRLPIDGWIDAVAAATTSGGDIVIVSTRRGERDVPIAVVDGELDVRASGSVVAPGTGPLVSSSVRVVAVGPSLVVSWSGSRRMRGTTGQPTTVDDQAVTVIGDDIARGAGLRPEWLALDPAGSLHHSLVGDGGDRVLVVHGNDDAFVTEFRVVVE